MKTKVDFKKVAMSAAGGAAAGVATGFLSNMLPASLNNPIVKAALPAVAGLAIEFIAPKQKDLAAGAYGAAGYTLGQALIPSAMNGTFSINGTQSINGTREEVLKQLVEAKKAAQIEANNGYTSFEPVNGTQDVRSMWSY